MVSPTHFIFVDFENVPSIDLRPVEGRPVMVKILLGRQQKKLDLALVQQIRRLAAQVDLIEVGASGRNALDLTLACYLGRAVQATSDAQFHIVSGDKDFDPLIAHLRAAGLKVARHPSIASVPFAGDPAVKPAASGKNSPKARLERFIAGLRNPGRNDRPARRRTLIKHIKSQLGKETSDEAAETIVQRLCADGILKIVAGEKIGYPPF